MTSLFTGAGAGSPAPLPPPPSPDSEDAATKQATQDAMENAAKAERKTKGRASTILTSGMGIEDKASSFYKQLMGK